MRLVLAIGVAIATLPTIATAQTWQDWAKQNPTYPTPTVAPKPSPPEAPATPPTATQSPAAPTPATPGTTPTENADPNATAPTPNRYEQIFVDNFIQRCTTSNRLPTAYCQCLLDSVRDEAELRDRLFAQQVGTAQDTEAADRLDQIAKTCAANVLQSLK